MRWLALFAMITLCMACSDRTVDQDSGPAADGPAADQPKNSPDGPAPDKPPKTASDGPQVKCPAQKPADGVGCSVKQFGCQYLIQKCPCGPSHQYWHCSCDGSKWSCMRDYDCYPCDGGTDKSTPVLDAGRATCKNGGCSGSSAGDCGCDWSCSDGKAYSVSCKQTSTASKDCSCLVNKVQTKTCSLPGSSMSCSAKQLAQCCGFPF